SARAFLVLLLCAGLICLGMAMVTHAKAAECGEASWYGSESGHRTANGERFPTREATAAHRSLPFNTRIRVVDQRTGRAVVVRLNDRGPAAWTARIIDLNPAAAQRLGILHSGTARVCLTRQ